MSGWVWLGLGVAALGYEAWALRSQQDETLPLTYYLRRVLRGPVWWVGIVAWVWVLLHLWFGW